MSNFPSSLDDDVSLPPVNDDITTVGADAINALRDAVFNIETEIGIGASGSVNSIANRLTTSLFPDGTIKPSAIASMGLVTLPIFNDQISETAGIVESKLHLDHRTQDLFNYITDLKNDTNLALGWISISGAKLDPHIMGAIYNHDLFAIQISHDPNYYFKNKFNTLRDNTDAFYALDGLNTEFLQHQWADGSPLPGTQNVTTNNGSTYPSNYGHTAGGIFLNTDRFSVIPQTAQDMQSFADFIDSASIFLYGTRIQNLYTNGISKVSRSSALSMDGYGAPLIPPTPAFAYLCNDGYSSTPFDDISTGDDIIEFKPSAGEMSSSSFDEKFALVNVGDIVRINYGTIEVAFIIKEKKYIQDNNNKKYIVRIAGKNLFKSITATARVDRSLVNGNKYGVLAIAAANNSFSEIPSLIVGSPTGAMALGLNFNPNQIDNSHYLLYLALFPTGHPSDGYTVLPGIDVSGNAGTTPGQYTLATVVNATNKAMRAAGFNYRFIAFSHQGEFGIMLADSYNNAGFSIISSVVSGNGLYDQLATNTSFPNNVISTFASAGQTPPDALGFGPNNAAIASPPYQTAYGSPEAAVNATKLFIPMRRNNYYVNGIEKDKLKLEVDQVLDGYGDGYWVATILSKNIFPGPTGHVETTYRIPYNLKDSNLKIGKTVVIQSLGTGNLVNFGRFIIQGINLDCNPTGHTDITVYDAVHAFGNSPTTTLNVGSTVALYFNSDSVSFNQETATDFAAPSPSVPFKRYFEVYVDQNGATFTHERARMNVGSVTTVVNGSVPLFTSTELAKFNILKISPKLKGFNFGSVNKITLHISNTNNITGFFDGYLGSFNGSTFTKCGPITSGRRGEVVRFYDDSNIDYIDLLFDITSSMATVNNQNIDIQVFPSLALDGEIMQIAGCQYDEISNLVSNIVDERQFGNTSEKDLSTSALNYIAAPTRALHNNGVVRGFDLESTTTQGQMFLSGGTAVVNGKMIQMNAQTVAIPAVRELAGSLYNINWAICVNDQGEIQPIPLLDFDEVLGGTPPTSDRIFNLFNVITSNSYPVDAVKFATLVTSRKDLTVLYTAYSVVSSGPNPTITLTTNDVRKFIFNESDLIPLTWTPGTSPEQGGHFRTIDALLTYIRKFGASTNNITVRGEFTFTSTLDLRLNKSSTLIFNGDKATFNMPTDSLGMWLDSNVYLNNIKFNYNSPVDGTGLIKSTSACILASTNTVSNTNPTNIRITNCIFNSSTSSRSPFILFTLNGNSFIEDIIISNNYFNDTVSDHEPAVAIVNNGASTSSPVVSNVDICYNIGNRNQAIYIVSTSALTTNVGLISLNVNIYNNRLGYIGYDVSGNYNNSRTVKGNRNSLSIYNNKLMGIMCPLNGNGTYSGAVLNHSTGNVLIDNNDVSFIHVQSRNITNTNVGMTTISNNRLFANNLASTRQSIFGIAQNNYAIYVTSNAITGNNDKYVFINNNVIGPDFLTATQYQYSFGIYCGTSSNIHHNTIHISGVDNIGIGISVGRDGTGSARHIIQHNDIYRHGTTITSYIGVGQTNANITDNFFDSSYTDAAQTLTTVITGPGAVTSDQYRNKNQTFFYRARPTETGRIFGFVDIGSGIGPPGQMVDMALPANSYNAIYEGGSPNTIARYGFTSQLNTSGNGTLSLNLINNKVIYWHIPLNMLPQGATLVKYSIPYSITGSAGDKILRMQLIEKGVRADNENDVIIRTDEITAALGGTTVGAMTTTDLTSSQYRIGYYNSDIGGSIINLYSSARYYILFSMINDAVGSAILVNIGEMEIQYIY